MNDQFNFDKQFVVLQSDRKKASDCKKRGQAPLAPPSKSASGSHYHKIKRVVIVKK